MHVIQKKNLCDAHHMLLFDNIRVFGSSMYMISTFGHAPRLITYTYVLWGQSAAGKTEIVSTYA
jgi:hypothetical protein